MARQVTSHRAAPRLIPVLLAILLGACTSAGNKPAFSVDELFSATIAGQPSLRFFPSRAADPAAAIGWSNAFLLPQIAGGRLDLLALSAGGPDTAFSAGAYKGLNAAAQWPSYEIVTATSTAALIAPFIFVGAGNQAAVEGLLTGKTLSRLLVNPFYRYGGPPKSAGRAYAAFIARTITPQLIASVAAEHARGRRLLIATANLDTSQLTVWNMGAIASLGLPGIDLFRNVIHAASALPGVLPPVQINTQSGLRQINEMHGDASILTHFYADTKLLPDALRNPRWLWPGGTAAPGIDILVNSKIDVDAKPIERKSLTVAGAPGASVIRTSLKLLINDSVREAAAQGLALRYAFLPPEWRTVSQTDFDSGYQRDTFDFGFQRAISGTLWTQGERN